MSQGPTLEVLRELAPDPKAWDRASELAYPQSWTALKKSGDLIWARYYNYQVAANLRVLQGQCTCPSRQKPCKHALGLMVLHHRYPNTFQGDAIPEGVATFASKSPSGSSSVAPKSLKADENRIQQRLQDIGGGLVELRLWLRDAVQMGLANLEQLPDAQWTRIRARLTDAKASGLANRIDALKEAVRQENGHRQALHQIGLLQLFCEGFRHLEELGPEMRQEIFNQAGINQKKADILSSGGLSDHWIVLGRRVEIQERFDIQRTWLQGRNTKRLALLLEFSLAGSGFEVQLDAGQAFHGALCYYPAGFPIRALIQQSDPPHSSPMLPFACSLDENLERYANALSYNPWLDRYPMVLDSLRATGDESFLVDEKNQVIPLHPAFSRHWELLALSGGSFFKVMGEWDGYQLFPLAAAEGSRWVKI